jgi:hypothetical protein
MIFVLIVTLSGLGLFMTGNIRDPFTFIHSFDSSEKKGASLSNRGKGDGLHKSENSSFGGNQSPEGQGQGKGKGLTNDIQWSQGGLVLFDLWILGAIAALYMIIQQSLKRIRSRHRMKKGFQPAI